MPKGISHQKPFGPIFLTRFDLLASIYWLPLKCDPFKLKFTIDRCSLKNANGFLGLEKIAHGIYQTLIDIYGLR